jgi:hypothetical protein
MVMQLLDRQQLEASRFTPFDCSWSSRLAIAGPNGSNRRKMAVRSRLNLRNEATSR